MSEGKVAAVVLINEKKEILFYLRDNKQTIPHPNKWCLLGGHMEEGETPFEALKREIKEEINFNITENNFIGVMEDLVGNLVYIFKHKITKELEDMTLNEGQRLGYFKLDEAQNIDMPQVLKDFLKKHEEKILK